MYKPHSIVNKLDMQENVRGNFNIPPQKRIQPIRKATHDYNSAHEDPAL